MAKENNSSQEDETILDNTDIEDQDDLDTENDNDGDGSNGDGSDDGDDKDLTPEEKLAKAQSQANKYRRLYKKAKNGAGSKPAPVKKPDPASAEKPVDVDERILISQGMDEQLLKELKDVAALKKISLFEAQKNPLFVTIKEKFEKDQKSKESNLPASRGTGSKRNSEKKDFNTPGLSATEHRKMFNDLS